MAWKNVNVQSQALADALANARWQLANERRAVEICRASGLEGHDLRFALSEVRHFEALVARLAARLASFGGMTQ